jgi:hypothetical protein
MSPTSSQSFASAGSRPTSRRTSTTPGTARRRSAIDGRTTRHPGYARSQRIRKRIEEVFGWLKTVAGWRKTRFRGLDRTEWGLTLALAAYNLTRMPKLLGAAPMTAPMGCRVIGRWRIVEADIWERDYLDLVEPAMMVIGADGQGDIAFGALQTSLDLAYGRSDVAFTFVGSDEMDGVRGSGSAELLEDGTLEIELDFDHGDDAIPRAERAGSSATC